LLCDLEVDLGLFRLQPSHELVAGGLQPGFLDIKFRISEIGLIVLRCDLRLTYRLIKRGLSLFERGFLLHKLLLCAAGIESNDWRAFFDGFTSGRHPCDCQVRHNGRVNWDRPAGFHVSAGANDDKELAFACTRNGQSG
jgi:hypothetical protein